MHAVTIWDQLEHDHGHGPGAGRGAGRGPPDKEDRGVALLTFTFLNLYKNFYVRFYFACSVSIGNIFI